MILVCGNGRAYVGESFLVCSLQMNHAILLLEMDDKRSVVCTQVFICHEQHINRQEGGGSQNFVCECVGNKVVTCGVDPNAGSSFE